MGHEKRPGATENDMHASTEATKTHTVIAYHGSILAVEPYTLNSPEGTATHA